MALLCIVEYNALRCRAISSSLSVVTSSLSITGCSLYCTAAVLHGDLYFTCRVNGYFSDSASVTHCSLAI